MPIKMQPIEATPSLVMERLEIWGRCIRTQRKSQRITAANLCKRMSISPSTLRRLEMGDPGAGAGAYLNAMMILGLLELVVPTPPIQFWNAHPHSRARLSASGDDDF